jgi:hypothetical protein
MDNIKIEYCGCALVLEVMCVVKATCFFFHVIASMSQIVALLFPDAFLHHSRLLTFLFLPNIGYVVAQCLRCCATNRKFAGSIPAGVSGFLIDIKSFRSHYGPGIDSASNRNEYQEYFLGVKAAGAYG